MVDLVSYLFYFVASTTSNLQRRHIALRRDTDKGQVNFAFHIAIYCFVGSFILLLFKQPEFNQSPSTLAALAAVCGVAGALSIIFQYIAQRHVEAGITTLAVNIYTPITIALASIFLHEGLKFHQLIGTLLLLVAVVMVSRKHRLSRWKFDRYFVYTLLSGVFLAFCLTAERSLIKENGITTGTILSWGGDLICLAAASRLAGTKSQYNLRDTAVTGVLRYFQQISWVIMITVVANLSLVASITTFRIVIIFVAGAIFLHEREDLKRKIIGSMIATAGLMLMI